MNEIVFIVVILCAFFLSFFRIRQGIDKYFYLFYSIILGAFSTQTGDTEAYAYIFTQINNGTNFNLIYGEYGFKLILYFFGFFTTNYLVVSGILVSISLVLMFRFVNLYCKDIRLTYALYLIYPFFTDVAQVRNLIGTALLLTSIDCLLKNKGKISFILLGIASFIHTLFFVYFLMYLTRMKWNIKQSIVGLLCGSGGILCFIYLGMFDFAIEKLYFYNEIGAQSEHFGYLVYIFADIILILSMLFMQIRCKKNNSIEKRNIYIIDFTLKLYIVLICTLPLLLFNLHFYRIYRNVLMLAIISFTIYLSTFTKNYHKKYLLSGCVIVFYLLLTVGLFTLYSGYSQYVELAVNILDNNLIGSFDF